jgi:hypothetical protein
MQTKEYVIPEITVVECCVEKGFAVSEMPIGGWGDPA